MNQDWEKTIADIQLSGQTAVVTGAGRGIGRAIARTLAGAGAAVAAVSRSADELAGTVALIRDAGGQAESFPADVTEVEAVRAAVAEVERRWGQIDLLVNNAGTGRPIGPVALVAGSDWWRCLEVNLKGPFSFCQAVLPAMTARGAGRIINVASGAGLCAIPHFSAYVVSKTALIRFTETLAAETLDHGIRVFAINPGTVRTAMVEDALQSADGKRWAPWFADSCRGVQLVAPERAARLALFLASGQGDALTGRFLEAADNIAGLVREAERIRREELYTLRLRRLP